MSSSLLYIGLTIAGAGVYRSHGGGMERLVWLSVPAAAGWPAWLVRVLFARAILDDALVGEPAEEQVAAFAEELLGDVERYGLFSPDGACIQAWLERRGEVAL